MPAELDIKQSENSNKILIATGKEEYEVPDPNKFVTKVISPEKELKKRLMAKELESALQEQIANKKRAKEEERKHRIIEEIREEEKWRKEKEEFERENSPKQVSRKENVDILKVENEENKEIEEPEEDRIPSSPPSQPPPEPVVEKPKFTHKLDLQLKALQNEMIVKEKEFNQELEKLKNISSDQNNARDNADKQLTYLKDHIVRRENFSTAMVPTLGFKQQEAKLHLVKSEKNSGVGKYSKLYFTDYNKALTFSSRDINNKEDLLNKGRYKNKFGPEHFLPGESQMLPWKPFEESPKMRIKARTMQDFVFSASTAGKTINTAPKGRTVMKSTYEKLDDLMKEFLSHKKREDYGRTVISGNYDE